MQQMTEKVMCGGWTAYRDLTSDDKLVFVEVTKGLLGVDYTPEKVSTQVVAGMNYRFRCEARVPGPSSECYEAIVQIFAPLEGKPYITDIHRI